MKKFLAILLAAIMVFSFAACGEKKEEGKEPVAEPKVLNIATKGNPVGLCPLTVAVGSANTPIQQFLFDRLFEFDSATGNTVPMLAKSYEVIDATHVKVEIRDDVYAYDGTTKFTASDVKFSLKLACDTGNAANYFNKYFDADAIEVVDDTHVILAFAAEDPFIMTAVSNIPYAMVCEKLWDSTESQNLFCTAGTGPYKIKEWVQDSYVLLEKNANYWGGTPYYDEIKLLIITDASSRVMSLESGEVDICLEPNTADVVRLMDSKDVTVFNAPTSNNYTLFLNNQKAPFDDIHARRACALALDYENNVKVAVSGLGIAIDSMLPKTNKYYVKPTWNNYFHYDVEAAKAEWAQSKYAGKEIEVELSYAEGATWDAYATLIQQQWEVLGIKVKPAPMATAAFYDYIAAGSHTAEMINNSSPDPQAQYQFYDSRIGFKAARGGAGCAPIDGFQDRLDQAKLAATSEADRAKLYGEIQQILDEYVPSIPLYIPTKTCLTNNDIKGIILTTVGDINASKAYE